MKIQAEKLEIMKMILATDNANILESIKNLFKKELKTDFWETLPREQKDEILMGITEIENAEIVDYEDFMRNIDNRKSVKINPKEKIKLNEAIWDENMSIPEEHKTLVLDRIKKAKKNPERLLNWDKASKTLKTDTQSRY